MLSHYFDIKAIPQADMLQSEVVALVIQGLHGELPPFAGGIGLAFPGYGQRRTLGGIVRVLGALGDLENLHATLGAGELIDYALIGAVTAIPSAVKGHLCFARKHIKGASDSRRAEKRLAAQGVPAAEIARRLQEKARNASRNHVPHVHLESHSTGQKMVLCVTRHRKQKAQIGPFSGYGLSRTATVPDF